MARPTWRTKPAPAAPAKADPTANASRLNRAIGTPDAWAVIGDPATARRMSPVPEREKRSMPKEARHRKTRAA